MSIGMAGGGIRGCMGRMRVGTLWSWESVVWRL
jgi:hypothetical protein